MPSFKPQWCPSSQSMRLVSDAKVQYILILRKHIIKQNVSRGFDLIRKNALEHIVGHIQILQKFSFIFCKISCIYQNQSKLSLLSTKCQESKLTTNRLESRPESPNIQTLKHRQLNLSQNSLSFF